MTRAGVKRRALPAGIDLLAVHAAGPDAFPYLLQSSSRDGKLGRYDILFALPGESLVLESDGTLTGPESGRSDNFFDALDAWAGVEASSEPSDPFNSGWFVYLGYELAGYIEPTLKLDADTRLPAAFATRCRAAVIHDHRSGEIWLSHEADVPPRELEGLLGGLDALTDGSRAPHIDSISEDAPEHFLSAVEAAKSHIAAGDIYQANLSRGWEVTLDPRATAPAIYQALCAENPAPFAGIVNWSGTRIISSSPERLLELRDGYASTRPIAGTRPRSSDEQMDGSLSAELLAHPKERAEHVMLIDLERNDLGRICQPGTVEVNEKMVIESYAHVHHIVSNVRGRLRDGVSPGEAIRAVFPGGTITGCPKVKCMEIVSGLELGPRGAYTGSFGYLDRNGTMDLNILIRTMVMRDQQLTLRAGSGIVADSEPQAELAETRAKAKGLLHALES